MARIRRAILSVSDKSGIAEFAKGLSRLGVELYASGGTAGLLRKKKIPVRLIEEYTGFPEMLDGRVKTLNPKIHGGLLAVRKNASHMKTIASHGIVPFDLVVVNLYPFEATIEKPDCTLEEAPRPRTSGTWRWSPTRRTTPTSSGSSRRGTAISIPSPTRTWAGRPSS
jgi:phosphoribosylaminoimidazolecarboxamide formyltransferase/IMP cyclohydrolase